MSLTYSLPVAAIKAHLIVAPKDDVRSQLNSVYLDTARGALVSTDGSITLVSRHEGLKQDGPSVILPREHLAAAVKQVPKRVGTFELDVSPAPDGDENKGAQLTFRSYPGAALQGRAVNRDYPAYERVIPRTVDGTPGSYDVSLLAKLGDALQTLGECRSTQEVCLYQNGTSAALVQLAPSAGAVAHVGVIMGCRTGAVGLTDLAASVAEVLS
jgi:hypothetical protein